MGDLRADALELSAEIDRSLCLELESACECGLAFARLAAAIPRVVEVVGHPALTLLTRETPAGQTHTVYFLGHVLMRWCFSERCVNLYCSSQGLSRPTHLRFRYAAPPGEWRITMPGRPDTFAVFRNEEEKILEILRDAIAGLSPGAQADRLGDAGSRLEDE